MKLVNKDFDYHMHTLNFSDGTSTIEELVQYAGKVGLKEIIITDHSHIVNTKFKRNISNRRIITRWKNVHNDVKVRFGVEADILNEAGDICTHITGLEGEFIVLAAHDVIYEGDPKTITEAYINAIERFHDRIDILAHVDANYFGEFVDVKRVVEAANKHNIIVEFNAKNLSCGRNVPELTKAMLDSAETVMVNSDAHCLADFNNREQAFRYLEDNGYLNEEENV